MQYVGRAIGSVSKTWSSINPSTLSGAIDVIVVEQPDGTLSCSPFHVRFGKFQILKPSQKRVEVLVNGKSTNIPMKLSDTGEAYFVFETYSDITSIPTDLIGSPVSSAPNSPQIAPTQEGKVANNEPEYLDLGPAKNEAEDGVEQQDEAKNKTFQTKLNKRLTQIHIPSKVDNNGDILLDMEGYIPNKETMHDTGLQLKQLLKEELGNDDTDINKFIKEDVNGNIRIVNPYEHITSSSSAQNQTEGLLLSPTANIMSMSEPALVPDGSSSPVGDNYNSNNEESLLSDSASSVSMEDRAVEKLNTDITTTEKDETPQLNYIKTLRLTSDQLRCLNLNYGENDLTYSIDQGKSIITSKLFVWRWDVPIVISDIDGTITKSDALGHVLAMIGKDWTHAGVAKLFNEIFRNGYNIMYLTARGIGQADSTRGYLRSINQDGTSLPVGPVILSPDRTMAALRREVILKEPQVFKIACLNDIRSLYTSHKNKNKGEEQETEETEEETPFFAGFGNRITDALSYRTVGIPSSRIFTINTEGEVHMELLELAGYKSSYLHINELVDHFFPPVSLINDDIRSIASTSPGSPVNNSIDNWDPANSDNNNSSAIYDATSLYRSNRGEKFTDVNFWREPLLDLDDLSDISTDDDNENTSKLDNKSGSKENEKGQGGLITNSSPKSVKSLAKNLSNRSSSYNDGKWAASSPIKSDKDTEAFLESDLPNHLTTTPDKAKSKEDIGKEMYLTLGSPLNSPVLSSVDTTYIDNDMRRLSLSKPPLPTSGVSRINVLDDIHSLHTNGSDKGLDGDIPESGEEEFEYEDEFDDDEFDEDEFVD